MDTTTPTTGEAPSPPRHIFVYGTLRTAYSRLPPSIRRLRPPQVLQAPNRWVGVGTISGYDIYDLGDYPGVVATLQNSKTVTGDVFRIEPSELPLLDEYEGISADDEAPHQYTRVEVQVALTNQNDDGERENENENVVSSWLYLYNWPVPSHAVHIENGDYVKYCESQIMK